MSAVFYPGLDVTPTQKPMGFTYGADCFGPQVEVRRLDSIRASLLTPDCDGPQEVYSIAMDVGKKEHLEELKKRMLLYGAVTYASGRLGREPVRSQGHIHKVSGHCGWSTPEVYEIWSGSAIIYMQQYAKDNPGHCYAVRAQAGDVVVVPPYWAHATISTDPNQPLTFGAWCDRDFGFEYADVRAHKGLAWYPLYDETSRIVWQANPLYNPSQLVEKAPEGYAQLGIQSGVPIYTQFEQDLDRFLFVSNPARKQKEWNEFVP